MSQPSPFDARPDQELGRLLREALTANGESAFVGRVMTAADERELGAAEQPWWQVLRGWAWPGLAAALALAMGATIWASAASNRNETDATLETVFLARARSVAPSFLVATTAPPSFDRALASSLEP